MRTEIKFRTFDELLDSVKIDIKGFDLEGLIDSQSLIKIALKINYDLGLKINQSKSKILELSKGKAKLPEDFYVLNFAMLCDGKKVYKHSDITDKTYSQGVLEGVIMAQKILDTSKVNQFTTTINVVEGSNIINHGLHTNNIIVQAFDPDGTMLSFEILNSNLDNVNIISKSQTVLPNIKFVIIGAMGSVKNTKTCSINADSNGNTYVTYRTPTALHRYEKFIPLHIEKNKSISDDCFNINALSQYGAKLKNGFFVTNFDEGSVYINYQSLMEDDDNNLLVMDHPLVNEYYEYAFKQRIYENLMLSGENVSNYLQLMEQRLVTSRYAALSFINTPDFNDFKNIWELNRKAQYSKYYNMFKSK